MKKYIVLSAILLVNVNIPGTFAGGNELFEAKTSTAAIEETSYKVLTSVNRDQRKAMKIATQASRDALKAYKKCPRKSKVARKALVKTVRNLQRQQDALAGISTTDDSILALTELGAATINDIESLLLTDTVCDQGTNLLQSELVFNPAAPFVAFASGWGKMPFGSHGTFGDFSAGLAAPDHVHGGTYYGVVINGILKNPFGEFPNADIASAKELPAGSFWSVPANAIHTTACTSGANCLFYFHSRSAFDFDTDISEGETMDADAQEISASEIALELAKDSAVISPFARMFTTWGDRGTGAHGTIGEFIPGGTSPEHTHSHSYHGVVLSGTMVNPFLGQAIGDARHLQPGDYWFVPAGIEHITACISVEPCTFYFHSEGGFDFLVTAGNG